MELIHAPNARVRLGDYLIAHLQDQQWLEFRGAVAFARRSGTAHIKELLTQFDARASVRLSVGVDMLGTSREALRDFLDCVRRGSVWIFHNAASTFHPKLFLFKNRVQADLLVGSGNLTEGGLFTNYEAALAVRLALSTTVDAALLSTIEHVLDQWSNREEGVCRRLTHELLEELQASRLVASEAQLRIAVERAMEAASPNRGESTRGRTDAREPKRLFRRIAVPPAPRISGRAGASSEPDTVLAEAAAESVGPAAEWPAGLPLVTIGGSSSFVMTLQTTDMGVGQTTPGTARRSPEVFIPLAALDANQAFWKFPDQFQPDAQWNRAHPGVRRNGIGKMDRRNVPMRIGVVQEVNMFFNPQKRDLRLRSETLRSAGSVGDILWIRAVDPSMGFEYDVQIAPRRTPLFNELQRYCTVPVGRGSQKFFGYF